MQCVLVTITGHEISICEMWHRHWTTYNVITTSVTGPPTASSLHLSLDHLQRHHHICRWTTHKVMSSSSLHLSLDHLQRRRYICHWTTYNVIVIATPVAGPPTTSSLHLSVTGPPTTSSLHLSLDNLKNNQLFTPFWLQFKLASFFTAHAMLALQALY